MTYTTCGHTTERDYTYLSPRHNTYSRIDLFIFDKWLLQNFSHIHTTTWPDHAPISITLNGKKSQPNSFLWCTNKYLLQNPTHAKHISERLEEFFTLNSGSVADPMVVWNTHKAYIRGVLIQLGSQAKKERTQSIDTITAAIKKADDQNKINPSPQLVSELFNLRHKLCSLLLCTLMCGHF